MLKISMSRKELIFSTLGHFFFLTLSRTISHYETFQDGWTYHCSQKTQVKHILPSVYIKLYFEPL